MLDNTSVNLEAVNTVLSSIGDAPVDTIEDPTNVNVINAIRELETVSRKEQAKGWSSNIIDSYILNPDVNTNQIMWNSNFLSIVDSGGLKLVRKGEYLYNLTDQTFIFTSAITVQMILFMDLAECSEQLKNYIVAKTSEQFQMKFLNDPNIAQSLQQMRMDAWVDLQENEITSNAYNIFENEDITAIRRS